MSGQVHFSSSGDDNNKIFSKVCNNVKQKILRKQNYETWKIKMYFEVIVFFSGAKTI